MTRGERLRAAIERSEYSIRAFQRAMEAKDVSGSTYPTINAYLKDESTPSLEFMEEAADLLAVRPEWLAFERGEPTTEQEENAQYLRFAERPDLTDFDIEDAFSYFPDPKEAKRRYRSEVRAIARFSQTLQDAGSSGAAWVERSERRVLLQAALRFLLGVEDLVRAATAQAPDSDDPTTHRFGHDEIFLRASASPGWRTAWENAVLDLFSRRVRGLGERSEEFWDQHAPAANGPPPVDYSF